MYIYFDTNGTIKEVINDESIRRGSSDYNKIYCYLEGNPDIDDIWYLQKNPDGTLTNEVSFVDNIVTKAIPYDAKRDMKYFQDFEEYQFYVFTLSSSYLSQNGLVVATIRVAENNTLWALGELTFNVQANIVNSDNDITQSQYDYLLLTISSYYSKTEIDNKLSLKADKSDTYTKTQVDSALALKADKSTAITYTGNQLQDYNGNNIYPVINDANYEVKKNYIKKEEALAQGTTSVTLNVSFYYSRTLVFKFTANASNTYMNMVVNNVNVTGTQLINSGNSYIFKLKLQQDISSVSVWSGQSTLLMDVYYDIEQEILDTSEITFRNNVRLNGIESTVKNGYLDSGGVERSSNDYKIATLIGVNEGDIIQYTGCYGSWATLWGYKSDGTAVALNSSGNNILEYLSVPTDIVTIKAFSQNSIEQVYLIDLGKTSIPINQNATIISYCKRTNYQSTINSIGKRTANVTYNANYANICFKTKTINVTSSSDYVLTRFKIKSDTDCMIETVAFLVNTEQQGTRYFLEANRVYEFYNFSKGFANIGTFNFQIQIPVVSSAITLDILDLIIVKNSMDVWYDEESKETLKTFSPNNLIVDADGNGNFYDISHACVFAKKCYDVLNENVTIFVNKGYYLEHPTNSYPYACINKGANKISIIGVNSNDVIIDCYNTSSVQSKVLDIGGECTIKGLTIRCLNDGTYNSNNDLGHNAYCIHNDSSYSTNEEYTTLVEDCILYSECHSPLGAGLRNKQTQKYKNVTFISNGIISNGACYIHASAESTASDMEVIIDNCICDSKDGTKAITLPDVNGSLPYTSIPTTICKTIGVTSGANVTDSNFKTTHLLTNISVLNNVNDWNYEV